MVQADRLDRQLARAIEHGDYAAQLILRGEIRKRDRAARRRAEVQFVNRSEWSEAEKREAWGK